MDALYAFLRVTDDLADDPGETSLKRATLAAWRAGLIAALDGRSTHAFTIADAVERYRIPQQFLLDVLDGVESDLEPVRFTTFAELYPYCYRVAAAVGLACVRVWGLKPALTRKPMCPPRPRGSRFS